MERTIGVGVIGMGWMGQAHSRAYVAVRDRFRGSGVLPRLVICSDSIEARALEARERFGFERATVDWQEVLANPDVEAVNVTAPNGMHLEMNRAAAQAGKHILCEKPVGRFPEDTIGSYRAATQAGILTLVGYNYRWAPLVQYAHQLIEQGELGVLTHFHGRFLNGYASDPGAALTWRFLAEEGLGTLGDLGSHVLDLAHFLAGPIARVVSNRHTFISRRPLAQSGAGQTGGEVPAGDVTNEDYVSVLARFQNGAQGMLEACRVINGAQCDLSFEVHGTKGALKWSFERMNELQFQRRNDENPAQDGCLQLLSGPTHPFHQHFNPARGVGLSYDDLKVIESHTFLQAIASGTPAEPGFAAACRVAQVEQAIMRSWESERWEDVSYDL